MDRLIKNRYRILTQLGSGSFGEIFEVQDTETLRRFAIKLEKRRPDKDSRLMQEVRVYQALAGAPGVCQIYDYGSDIGQDLNFLVLDKLAYSLEDLLHLCKKSFSKDTVYWTAEQILERLERFHEMGYVHRDLKTGNFMVGPNGQHSLIYIIDFGLAKPYRDPKTNMHILKKGGKSMVGTAKYASIASHDGYFFYLVEQCRRDDLESLGYLLIYFMKGSLPWQGIKSKVKTQKYAKIGELKRSITPQVLCQDLPKQLLTYLRHVRAMQFTEKPNYTWLRELFRKGRDPNACFDWEPYIQKNLNMELESTASISGPEQQNSFRKA